MTHKRLFTIKSFSLFLKESGFRIIDVKGFGPPIRDMIGNGFILSAIDALSSCLAGLWPSLFAFNFLITAEKLDDLEAIYSMTVSGVQRGRQSVDSKS